MQECNTFLSFFRLEKLEELEERAILYEKTKDISAFCHLILDRVLGFWLAYLGTFNLIFNYIIDLPYLTELSRSLHPGSGMHFL